MTWADDYTWAEYIGRHPLGRWDFGEQTDLAEQRAKALIGWHKMTLTERSTIQRSLDDMMWNLYNQALERYKRYPVDPMEPPPPSLSPAFWNVAYRQPRSEPRWLPSARRGGRL